MALSFSNFALAVADLPAMTDFYRGLGFAVSSTGRFDAVGADYVMLDGAGIRLELVSRPGMVHTPVDRTPPPDHLGLLGWRALVLESSGLSALTASLKAAGTEIVWAELDLSPTHRSTMIRDPEGNLINIFAKSGS